MIVIILLQVIWLTELCAQQPNEHDPRGSIVSIPPPPPKKSFHI